MNKILIAVNVLLVAAVATLFGLVLSGKSNEPVSEVVADAEVLPVAYVNVDSVLVKYNFAIDANEQLMKKQEDARLKINTKLRSFQNDVNDFQRKLQNNAFLSRERAEQAQQALAKKEQDIQQLEAKLTQEILEENQKVNAQLADSLTNYLNIFNEEAKYHIIFSNNAKDNLLLANEQYDITEKIIEGLNARYQK
ncbi:MAG: OmpH family outer membrane protein [Paludibacteraceae bacterium]|nr:OmpH family outer membrane protein [Paludibacteraceae bacterium]